MEKMYLYISGFTQHQNTGEKFLYKIVSPDFFIAEEDSLRSDLVNAMLFPHGILLFNRWCR